MWFIALASAIAAAVYIQYIIYKKKGFSDLTYTVSFGADEVLEGDYIYLYEKIVNDKRITLPFVKVDTDLPEGLEFTLIESVEGSKVKKIKKIGRVQSVFILRPGTQIERRWRVYCARRGEYKLEGAIMVITDLLGLTQMSKRVELTSHEKTSLTVLPTPIDLNENYASSRYLSGDVISDKCITSDPQRLCGVREYTIYDPMNKINWKSTASHSRLMVNLEEKVVRHSFSVILNMNSRLTERYADDLVDRGAVERGISVCAAIFNSACELEVPIRFFSNTDIDEHIQNLGADRADDSKIGSQILSTRKFQGKRDLLYGLRILSAIKPKISVSAEKMLDYILENIEQYNDNENFVIVTPYLDQRMINYHAIMKRQGIDVIFYVTSGRVDVAEYPENIEIYYRTY